MEKRVRLPTLLRPDEMARVCRFGHVSPAEDLASFLAVAWTMEWRLGDGEVLEQPVLPNPCVHIMVSSAEAPQIWGVVSGAFSATLAGEGFVFGLRFRPCGFYAFCRSPVSAYTDRRVGVWELLPHLDVRRLTELASAREWRGVMDCLEGELRLMGAGGTDDDGPRLIEGLVEQMSLDATLMTAEAAASSVGVSLRTLQRMFRTYVGVGPKWVIRRFRLKDAAARIVSGEAQDWAELANRLGYFDQAHLIKDFKRMVGATPAAFAKGASS